MLHDLVVVLSRGTSSREVSAQPCPAWVTIAEGREHARQLAKSASSSTIIADLPPSSRKTRLTVSLAAAMIRRPVAVEPVKVTTSTSGWVVSASPTAGVRRGQHVDHAGRDVGVRWRSAHQAPA